MRVRFLLGPAGSGKTWRCLAEIKRTLVAEPAGLPLLLVAPKQATYQLERQLLATPDLPGYVRLQIVSFERLADSLLATSQKPARRLLDEEGRVMVLRALLAQNHPHLRLFGQSARQPGFAGQLSQLLREFQCYQHSPARLEQLADRLEHQPHLGAKLHDLAWLLRAYRAWLEQQQLLDAGSLLEQAKDHLHASASVPATRAAHGPSNPHDFAGLWLDGFAELTPQEVELLAELVPRCAQATLAFCLEDLPADDISWLSTWSVLAHTFRRCYQRLAALPQAEVAIEVLPRDPAANRFGENPVLAHLERYWTNPRPFETAAQTQPPVPGEQFDLFPGPGPSDASSATAGRQKMLDDTLMLAECATPWEEAVLAARTIAQFVQRGRRYRDCAVLLRQFEGYQEVLQRALAHYGIPCFLDRREPVAHHPLAELTRYALRTVAFGWQHADWFGVLKTGLTGLRDLTVDHLENQALQFGWRGHDWIQPPGAVTDRELRAALRMLRRPVLAPLAKLARTLEQKTDVEDCPAPTGTQLAQALRGLWTDLPVQATLRAWSERDTDASTRPASAPPAALHTTVWDQLQQWLRNLELAFSNLALPLPQWLPILEAGLSGLTVGIIPPALDQVLIGVIDRSRNPDLKLALLLGLNESVFPARPTVTNLLTESERDRLANEGLTLALNQRQQVGRERFWGYVACTRSREKLVLAYSFRDAADKALLPSPFLGHIQRLFPTLERHSFSPAHHWLDCLHPRDLVAPLLINHHQSPADPALASLETTTLPGLPMTRIRALAAYSTAAALSPGLAARLHGNPLRTSVKHLEEFGACPFRFFVSAGMRGKERSLYNFDAREQGSFQHKVLARFHQHLEAAGRKWRAVSLDEARQLIGQIAAETAHDFRQGLLHKDESGPMALEHLTAGLLEFIGLEIGWMTQNEFDPVKAELGFGLGHSSIPPWVLQLGAGQTMEIAGQLDRVDLWQEPGSDTALGVIIDYKAGQMKISDRLMRAGIQLQLPVYLGWLRHLEEPKAWFGVSKLVPVGAFYINFRGAWKAGLSRNDTLLDPEQDRKLAWQHPGRFDGAALRKLDHRPDQTKGDQFHYRAKGDQPSGRNSDLMTSANFLDMLETVEAGLQQTGCAILAGRAEAAPYRLGSETACDWCAFRAICRFDPWVQSFRDL